MNKRSTKFYRKNEKEVMERLGFKQTRNSGATWIDKADGQNDHCICELKSTDKESYKIEQTTLHTLEVHAIEAHKLPVFALQFLNIDEVWLAVKESDIQAFKELIKQSVLEELQENPSKLYKLLGDFQKRNSIEISEENNEKTIDNSEEKSYIIGEGETGGEVEVNNFMPQTLNANKVKQNILARKKYKLDKQKQSDMYLKQQKQRRKEKNRDWKRN